MTVYFVRRVDDPSTVKIGSSVNINVRIRSLASSFGDLQLFATADGGVEVERLYQKAFAQLRVEGEWFQSTPELLEFIRDNATLTHTVFPQAKQNWPRKIGRSRVEQDAMLAHRLIQSLVDRSPATKTVSYALEETFLSLREISPDWTRRRVRSLYEGTARRIDAFEIADLLVVLDVPRSGWADEIRPSISHSETEQVLKAC